MEWYKIAPITLAQFKRCVRPIYQVLEVPVSRGGTEDVFLRAVMNKTDAEWNSILQAERAKKALQMKMGDFHEELAGCFPGYKNLKRGHSTGCDVAREDESEFQEWKNQDNTMNSSSQSAVFGKLTDLAKKGIRATLVLVNGRRKPRAPEGVRVLLGREIYAELSGRESFFDDLESTLAECFRRYPTYSELDAATS